MEYTVLHWNIHAKGGINYKIPNFVADTIINKNMDIVIMVEFYIGENFNYLRRELEDKYLIFISSYSSGYNQVLIALKKDKFKIENVKNIVTMNPLDNTIPEYLRLDIIKDNNQFSIVGTRVKTEGNMYERQMKFLDNEFNKMESFLCLGDFNITFSNAIKAFNTGEVFAPRIINVASKEIIRWSFVHSNYKRVGIDLIISKKIEILKEMEDDLSKKNGYKMFAVYDWDFISEKNGYKKLTSKDVLSSFLNKPDHAILLAKIKI